MFYSVLYVLQFLIHYYYHSNTVMTATTYIKENMFEDLKVLYMDIHESVVN